MLMRLKLVCFVFMVVLWGCSGDPDPAPGVDAGGSDVESDGGDSDVGGGDVGLPDADFDADFDVDPDADFDADFDADPDADPDPGLPDFEWPVETGPIHITPHESWKERIDYWDDPFIKSDYDRIGWVKFTILVGDPSRVIFQNSQSYPYHYDFATERLDPYLGIDRLAYDAISLHTEGQEVVLGAVLFPPQRSTMEVGIQLVGQDAYHPEMVRVLFELVKDSIDAEIAPRAFYFPSFEQVASTQQWASEYEARAIPVSSVNRWLDGDVCYSVGWAIGRVNYVPAGEIEEAYRTGALLSTDILLTDGVPADLPFVAGIVTLAPSTPNSHVAILANSYQVPFVYLPAEADQQAAMALDGHKGVLRARHGYGGVLNCDARLADATGLPAEIEAALLELKAPPEIAYAAKETAGHYAVPVDGLMPSDIVFYGGKAANFGMIRRALPNNSPEPIPLAFSFDLWDEFMAQEMGSGKTLKEEISERLAPFTTYPPPVAELEAALGEIVSMIRNDTVFTPAQETAILDALSGFEPTRRIRFRSSTNVEDSDAFTGAGLYDSNSGCLADDLDEDDVGPSLCNPDQANERGVFRAIRRVYGSFYNVRAFTERLRHGVDEDEVGMGMLVHYSDPDPTEMANGVITLEFNGTSSVRMMVVTQPGAASVTNPSDNAQPEIVEVLPFTFGTFTTFIQGSELLPLGATTLQWEEEYVELAEHVMAVVEEFRAAHPTRSRFSLDLEYKKLLPGKLIIRQVREIPRPAEVEMTPYLIPSHRELCTFQGEYGNIFANHRNKLRWTVGFRAMALDTSSRSQSLVQAIDGELLVDANVEALQGDPATWSGVSQDYADGLSRTNFEFGTGDGARTYSVEVQAPTTVQPLQTPIVFAEDLMVVMRTTYATPQPTVDWSGVVTETSEDDVRLGDCPPDAVTGAHIEREERIPFGDDLEAQTHYWWPPSPRGIVAGYTAPLVYFEETVVTGIGDDAIRLVDYFSQSYRPDHHNFSESFYFDFLLEPGLSAEVLSALDAEDIRALVSVSGAPFIVGFDGRVRGAGAVSF